MCGPLLLLGYLAANCAYEVCMEQVVEVPCGEGGPNFQKEGKFSIDVTIIIFIFKRGLKLSTNSF